MFKFECTACGGQLIEKGRFWICENCRTRYALGKDDEGNPFTYIPLDKKEIDHSQPAIKSAIINVNKISVKEIKLKNTIDSDVHKEVLHIESTQRIHLIENLLDNKDWDGAQIQINDFLKEDYESAEAQWFSLMCDKKVQNEVELLQTFSESPTVLQQKLEHILPNSNPLFVKKIIDIMFDEAYFSDEMCHCVFSTVLPYAKNEAVYTKDEYLKRTSYVFNKIIRKHFSRTFDYLLLSALDENEVDRYITYIQKFAESPETPRNEVIDYYSRILSVDPGNISIRQNVIKMDLDLDLSCEKCISDFENLLKYSTNPDDETYSIIKYIISFSSTTVNKAEFMWKVLGYHSKAPEGLKSELKSYSKVLLESSLWEQANRFIKLVLSFDVRDAETYFLLCLVKFHAKNEKEIVSKQENLAESREFAKCLSLYLDSKNPHDQARAKELLALTQEQKKNKNKNKKKKRVTLIVGITVALVVVCVCAILGFKKISEIKEEKRLNTYNEAIELFSNEKWYDASLAFLGLGDYKDSKEYYKKTCEKIDEINKNNEELREK